MGEADGWTQIAADFEARLTRVEVERDGLLAWQRARLETDDAQRNERAALVKALRRFAVVQAHRMAYGGSTVHVGWHCKCCDSEWDKDEPEKHKPSCLASITTPVGNALHPSPVDK